MSAPTKSPRVKPIRVKTKPKKPPVKTVLSGSLNLTWPKVDANVQEEILEQLKSTIEPLGIAKVRSLGKKKQTSEMVESPSINKELRSQLLIGINQVTKGLEKDDLRLVLTCQSAQPAAVTHHLIGLSASRNCPAVCLNGLSTTLGPLMNLKSTLAVGFRKISNEENPVFNDLVTFVSKSVPEINLPWIDSNEDKIEATLQKNDTKEQHETNTNQSMSEADQSQTSNPKLVSESDIQNLQRNKNPPQKDYSMFYVYKKDSARNRQINPTAINFTDTEITNKSNLMELKPNGASLQPVRDLKCAIESDKTVSEKCSAESRIPKKALKRKAESQAENFIKFSTYEPAKVIRVKANENRKHKRKSLKKQ